MENLVPHPSLFLKCSAQQQQPFQRDPDNIADDGFPRFLETHALRSLLSSVGFLATVYAATNIAGTARPLLKDY